MPARRVMPLVQLVVRFAMGQQFQAIAAAAPLDLAAALVVVAILSAPLVRLLWAVWPIGGGAPNPA